MDPNETPDYKFYSGDIFLSVRVTVSKVEAHSIEEVADSGKDAIANLLHQLPNVAVSLDDHDLCEVNRRPDFWDKVDEAYDRRKDGI